MTSPAPIGTAVLGFGLSATVFHLPFIVDNAAFRLVAIQVRSPATAAKAALAHPTPVSVVSTLAEVLGNAEVRLVVISTPPETHFPLAKAVIESGRHVVIEKPMCSTLAEAEELDRLSKSHGVVVAVYHNRRFDSDFLTLRDALDSGVLGTIVEYEAHYDRFRPQLKDGGATWKEDGDAAGSGLLYDLGSHLIDQALTLFGAPELVTATLFRQRAASKIDDAFHVVLQYPALVVTLKAGMLLAAPRPRFGVHGTKGSFVKYGVDVQEPQLRKGMKLTDPGFAVEPEENSATLTLVDEAGKVTSSKIRTRPGDYRQFYRLLAKAINEGGEATASVASVSKVIKVIGMAYQSHREKRSIPWY